MDLQGAGVMDTVTRIENTEDCQLVCQVIISTVIWDLFHCHYTASLHTQATERCEFFTYRLDTEDCNLYESDAEAGHLVEDPNFLFGPRICPTGIYDGWGYFKIWVLISVKLLSDNVGYHLAILPGAKGLADSDSPEECMVWQFF